jgi:nicotinamidase-related amidase
LIIDIRAFTDPSAVPILVLVDLQQEYLADQRALAIKNPFEPLRKCREALAHARARGLPVAFVRLASRSPFFNRSTRFSKWIDGFQPSGSDMVFEREQPSCYSCADFSEVIHSSGGRFALAGFAGESACLSTILDAFHRGHRPTYLSDASASHALDNIEPESVHDAVRSIAGLYGEVLGTRTWIGRQSRQAEYGERTLEHH